MKKLALFAASFAVLFASCSKDQDQDNNVVNPGEVVFEVSTVNQLNTRADLYSEAAIHEVEDVKVYAFLSDGTDYLFVKEFDFPSWTKGANSGRYAVAQTDNLAQGDYKFLAVGRDATDQFTVTAPTATTKFEDMAASIAAAGDATEIFAGSATHAITDEGTRVSIAMTRQVAGVLGYFKNVPTEIDGTTVATLRLTVSNSNLEVNLTSAEGSMPAGASYDILSFDFTGVGDNGNGAYLGNDLTAAGVLKLDDTQLQGGFVIPADGITLTLGLYAEDGTPLKEWNVLNAGATTFNIVANNFYKLGTKPAADSTDGDEPIDLMLNQEIAVTISPDWTAINDMTIQDQQPV